MTAGPVGRRRRLEAISAQEAEIADFASSMRRWMGR
jgi:hypothetical protein